MDHVAEVVLGYSRSKGQYHVDEIRGSWPTANYQCSASVPDQTVTVHVGDWLEEGEAGHLGARTHLIVRPYRAEGD